MPSKTVSPAHPEAIRLLRDVPEPILHEPRVLPHLPSDPRPSPFSRYNLSTHLIPSVVPRNTPYIQTLESLSILNVSARPGKDALRSYLTRATNDLLSLRQRFASEPQSEPLDMRQLWNCVNRYVRVDAQESRHHSNAFTLLFTHATGLHKEVCKHLFS